MNQWIVFKTQRPTEKGWYICTVEVPNRQRYVMSLFWHEHLQKFIDNIRDDMCHTYTVLAYNGERLFDVGQDRTGDVIAWKREPAPFMDGFVFSRNK